MKKFFQRISILFILFFIVDKPVAMLISSGVQAKQFDKRIALLCENQLSAQVFVIGSSRALNDIDAGALSENLDMECFNMGYSGSNLVFHHSVLKMILASGYRPDAIILTLDHGLSFHRMEQGIFRKDKLQPFSSYSPVYREICEHSNKLFWMGRLIWTYRENDNLFPALSYLKNGMDEADITSNVDTHGSIILEGRSSTFNVVEYSRHPIEYDSSNEDQALLESFKSILKICREQGIDLHIVIPPALNLNYTGFMERVKAIVQDRAMLHDFSTLITDEAFYYDNGHLNEKGAAILANELAKAI